MILICVGKVTPAYLIGGMVPSGEGKRYAFSLQAAADAVRASRPDLLVLEVRAGGTRERAVELIPSLRRSSPATEIVVATYSPGADEIADLVALGAYTYIDLDNELGATRKLRRVIAALRRRLRVA